MAKKVQLIINQSEITAGTRGASLGPDAIITAARKKGSTFFNRSINRIENWNHLLDAELEHQSAKQIDGLKKVFQAVSDAVQDGYKEHKFPFLIAADHGSAGGTMAGIKKQFPNKRMGVVWIDAHGDLHTPYTTPSGNMHGMPLATALKLDNQECERNQVDDNVSNGWNFLKEFGPEGEKLRSEDLVFIAVRDTEPEEEAILEHLSIKNHVVADVRSKGVSAIVESVKEQLSGCDIIYVSFDVDSMDPDLTSYGTGTPVKDGLTPEEAKEFLLAFAAWDKLTCMELVEVNPCLDEKINTMAEVSFDLIEAVVNQIES